MTLVKQTRQDAGSIPAASTKKLYMSKFYNPRDYDTIGFGGNRRHVLISDEEKRKRAASKKKHKKKSHEHYRKNWDVDLWD